MKKKVIIFDFDGTLVDSMDDFADLASAIMPRYFPVDEPRAREMYLESSGRPFHEQLETLFPQHQSNTSAATEFETTKKLTYIHRPLFTGAGAALTSLREQRLKTVVSSNNSQELVEEYIAQNGMSFDLILGWRPNFCKGEDHFNAITTTFGVNRSEMIFVGDSLHDGDRAHAAGIDFIAKLGTFTPEEFRRHLPGTQVITNLLELKALVS